MREACSPRSRTTNLSPLCRSNAPSQSSIQIDAAFAKVIGSAHQLGSAFVFRLFHQFAEKRPCIRAQVVEDVELMRKVVGDELGVKAAGGIRDKETAEAMLDAGADRLGASAGVQICAK